MLSSNNKLRGHRTNHSINTAEENQPSNPQLRSFTLNTVLQDDAGTKFDDNNDPNNDNNDIDRSLKKTGTMNKSLKKGSSFYGYDKSIKKMKSVKSNNKSVKQNKSNKFPTTKNNKRNKKG